MIRSGVLRQILRLSSRPFWSRNCSSVAYDVTNSNGCPDRPPTRHFSFLANNVSDKSEFHKGSYHHVTSHVTYPISLKSGKRLECINDELSNDRTYKFTDVDGDVQMLPSVTTVLQNTRPSRSQFSLRNWKRNMVKKHGEKEFYEIKKNAIQNGSQFHEMIEAKLRNLSSSTSQAPPPPPPTDSVVTTGHIVSVDHVLKDITEVCVLESVVCHKELGYSGTVDCVARYRSDLCVIDWKTSAKPKTKLADLYEYPLQAVAYAGAINADDNYPFTVDKVLIVIAYPTGADAHTHILDSDQCHQYWNQWLDRLEEHQTQFASDLSNVYL